ncbi:MAG: ATP-binding protein [Nitrospirota bacterium]
MRREGERSMALAPRTQLSRHRLSFIIILVAATAITVASTAVHYRRSLAAAEDALRFQALGIAASLEALLGEPPAVTQGGGPAPFVQRTIFRDIIAGGKWEGIAYIALYGEDGAILLHSNENLVGRRVEDRELQEAAAADQPVYRYLTLGTGERVFVMNYPLHSGPGASLLRVALHTFPVEEMVRQARYHLLSIAAIIVMLWGVGIFFMQAARRSEELKMAMAEKERLAVIGEMASVLAHEIRNPLGSIKGFAQYLREQQEKTGSPDRGDNDASLDIIVAEAERLERLTEDLLLYARPVELRPQELDLGALGEEAMQALGRALPETAACALHQNIPAGLLVRADRDKLKQVLLNLLHNALEAAECNGAVALEAEDRGTTLAIIVRDSGCGMDSETAAKALSPFYTTKTRGTGLGLAIVDKLVGAMGGTVAIESEPGAGTTFTITLPKNFI